MRNSRIALRCLTLALLVATSWFVPTQTFGQVRIPREAMVDVAELQEVFRVGSELEQERRWGEALAHYEKARKEFPGRRELEERLIATRFHYEVARRYVDSSFLETLRTIRQQDAAELYAEVLLKIHAHYVQRPDWNRTLRRGVMALEVAMAEPAFIERYGLQQRETSQTLQAARRHIESRPAMSRHEARQRAVEVAEGLERQLQIPAPATILEFSCAAAAALDDYSAFLTGNQLDEVMSQIEGSFVGLGIELKAEDHALQIVDVISGGPADRAGIRPGQRIVEVDGRSMRDTSTDIGADMLRGPEGSFVEVVVAGQDGAARRIRLQRQLVEVPSVENVAILDDDFGIGYLRLPSFQKTTNRDIDAALWELHRQGMRSLIVDVRGNPGGLLTASVEVADKFVSKGAIVSTRGRNSGEDYDYKAHTVGTWRVPLIVLVDGDSASASEIFAAAIRDHRRGTIVGTRSYGKGSVQGIFPLTVANAGVRLTTAKFYSPQGHPISGRGVEPDVVVNESSPRVAAKPVEGQLPAVDDSDDAVLAVGLQVARRQFNQGATASTNGRR
jgi:carboxyl-terminal processing protease